MVAAQVLKTWGRNTVWVRIPSLLPLNNRKDTIMQKDDRRTVSVVMYVFSQGDDLDSLLTELTEVKTRAENEGIRQIRLDVDITYGYYNDASANISLIGYRDETDEEAALRKQQAAWDKERKDLNDFALYQRLKNRFEKK